MKYYHVTRPTHSSQHEPFEIGQERDIGKVYNPFFHFFDGGFIGRPHDPVGHIRRYSVELLMEMVRLEINPALPSRLRCIWLCKTEQDARDWSKLHSRRDRIQLATVELENEDNIHRADSKYLTEGHFRHSINTNNAERYWRGEESNDSLFEYLYTGSLTVIDLQDL